VIEPEHQRTANITKHRRFVSSGILLHDWGHAGEQQLLFRGARHASRGDELGLAPNTPQTLDYRGEQRVLHGGHRTPIGEELSGHMTTGDNVFGDTGSQSIFQKAGLLFLEGVART
jgi:hypothetical protein